MLAFLVAQVALAADVEEYRLGPGDVVRVEVYGESFGGSFVVGSDGNISFPHCNQVPVGEQTTAEAEEALRTCLRDGFLVDPQVSVRVDEYRSRRVEVLGAIGKPGLYYLRTATTLRAMVTEAGGIHSERSTGSVVLTRANGDRLTLPLDELDGEKGGIYLMRGDVVNVDEGHVVFVGGEVQKPGAIGFIDGMTASQALMKAGGPTGLARLSGAYVLRGEERLSINLKRVLKGKDADVGMEPGDKLVIQESPL